MAINEKKMPIVIDNYFKSECNVDTSIRDAFEKGFRIGVKKTANRPTGEWILVCDGGEECDNLYRCSHCGQEVGCEEYDKPKFCGECGSDMRGE